jgi:hypothetical protein
LANIPVEDENDYGARQWGMETAGDDWIEDLGERERERQAEDFGSTPLGSDASRQIAVGESTEFRVKFARPCFTCGEVVAVGEMARGRKRDGGWDLFHMSCPPR